MTNAPATGEILAQTIGVTRRYGDVLALDGVDLAVAAGQTVGLLGPNGAGKSTLMSLLTGTRTADSGTVQLCGQDPRTPRARRSLGVTPQETGLPETLRIGEVVDFVSAHYPDPMPAGELLERFGLDGLSGRQTGALSGGQKRRLAVALAFVGRPRIVLLDEPTTGLDVDARRSLWDGIRAFGAEGGTVLLSSHYLEEIEELAERVVVLSAGRVVADDTVDAVRGVVGLRRVRLHCNDPAAATALSALPGVAHHEVTHHDGTGDRHDLLTADADALVRELVTSGIAFRALEVRPTTLEEAFLALTTEPGTTTPGTTTPADAPLEIR